MAVDASYELRVTNPIKILAGPALLAIAFLKLVTRNYQEEVSMYFLSIDERRLLLRKLLPEARAAGVAEELRGWNWDKPPLAPIYEGRLGVEEVASELCASGHDLYLRRVVGLVGSSRSGQYSSRARVGPLRAAAHNIIVEAKRIIYREGPRCLPTLAGLLSRENGQGQELAMKRVQLGRDVAHNVSAASAIAEWVQEPAALAEVAAKLREGAIDERTSGAGSSANRLKGNKAVGRDEEKGTRAMNGREDGWFMPIDSAEAEGKVGWEPSEDRAIAEARKSIRVGISAQLLREHVARRVMAAVGEALARHPRIEADSLVAAALPILVQRELDGSLLGLAKHLAVDMLVAGEPTPIITRFGPRREADQLAVAGYALIIESLWECPVNIGCVAYVSLAKRQVVVERDFHVLGDELRQLFIEARDERTRIVEEEIDPGMCSDCHNGCDLAALRFDKSRRQ